MGDIISVDKYPSRKITLPGRKDPIRGGISTDLIMYVDLIERQVRFLDQNPLQGHRMAAALSGLEEITITKPLSFLKGDQVGIILSLKGH